VKVREAKYIMFYGDIEGGRASHSWDPLLGRVIAGVPGFINRGTFGKGDKVSSSQVDASEIVHAHMSRAIVDNDDTFVHDGDRM
ncbi:hypothetical protein KR054_008820, partial [Drosophila jambulina]